MKDPLDIFDTINQMSTKDAITSLTTAVKLLMEQSCTHEIEIDKLKQENQKLQKQIYTTSKTCKGEN